jgi:uncharacterized DUF497 family protein
MIDLHRIEGFEWDQGNQEKNWLSHKVSTGDCEETFLNQPLLLLEDSLHSQMEHRHLALGQTNSGRCLFIAFTVRNNKIRVISARDMSQKERNLYDQTTA